MESDAFRTRVRYVQAHHVDAIEDARDWVAKFADATPTIETFVTDRYLKVHGRPGGKHSTFVARRGQWIVREEEASYRTYTDGEFRHTFESVGEGGN
jgi:hypothetical protein